jgi:PAS domain S-box-containing protein
MNPAQPSTPSSAGAVGRILIADDNRDSRGILATCLADEGYTVTTALDADEAMVRALSHPPDLFLLDVMMPGKDGFQLCRELRDNPILKDIPIVLVTGLDSKEHRFKGIEAGCDDFLSKPIERSELLTRVQTLVRLHAYRSQLNERKMFEAVLHHVSDGIMVLDRNGRIASLNLAAARLLNLDQENAAGKDLVDWLYRAFLVSVPRQMLVRPSEKSLRFEISRPEQPNSAPLFLAASLDVIPLAGGRIAGTVWTIRDVTGSKKESKLHRSFLSLVSHKLRSPIACITEHISLLQDGLLGELSAEQRKSVGRLQDQSSRLKELVDKMLTFIQTDEAVSDQAADAFMLNEALESAVSRVIARHPGKKVQVTYELPKDLYALGIAQDHFQVVIDHLVDNGIKFCDKPVAQITMGYRKSLAGQHEFTVMDNGSGIPSEEFERIFQEFYQLDKYFTGNVAGVGLGLALARRLVEKAGGRMWVSSELGRGTTFHFTLPIVGSAAHPTT